MKRVLDPGSSIFDRGEGIQLRRTGKREGRDLNKTASTPSFVQFPLSPSLPLFISFYCVAAGEGLISGDAFAGGGAGMPAPCRTGTDTPATICH